MRPNILQSWERLEAAATMYLGIESVSNAQWTNIFVQQNKYFLIWFQKIDNPVKYIDLRFYLGKEKNPSLQSSEEKVNRLVV